MKTWWKASRPADLRPVPWLHPSAIDYFASILSPDMRVIEHGSGGSTLWLAERVKWVVSFERNPEWLEAVKAQKPGNCVIMPVGVGVVPALPWKADLVFIDGEPVEDRRLWLLAARKMINPAGWLVLDNANRPEYAEARAALTGIATLEKVINGNAESTSYLVTEFWRLYA